jgi:hypothetical protein
MLLQPVHEAIVRGNLRRGVLPYVSLLYLEVGF